MDSGCRFVVLENVDELRWHRYFQRKSMIAVMRPLRRGGSLTFEVLHTDSELSKLAKLLKSLDGETVW